MTIDQGWVGPKLMKKLLISLLGVMFSLDLDYELKYLVQAHSIYKIYTFKAAKPKSELNPNEAQT